VSCGSGCGGRKTSTPCVDGSAPAARMSTHSIVQAALTNECLTQQGVVFLQESWTAYHYPGGAPRGAE
jgi:hypothetical protein